MVMFVAGYECILNTRQVSPRSFQMHMKCFYNITQNNSVVDSRKLLSHTVLKRKTLREVKSKDVIIQTLYQSDGYAKEK
jgi:hypothetical protein